MFAYLKDETDFGRKFTKQTRSVRNVQYEGGSTTTAEAQHFVRDSEQSAFSNWINRLAGVPLESGCPRLLLSSRPVEF